MGDKGVMAVGDDTVEGMQCSEHPYRNNPGGICAFCLQEKLGKLVSSSNCSTPFFSIPPLPSSPSFRSDYGGGGGTIGPAASTRTAGGGARKVTAFSTAANSVLVLKRSKSVAPRPMDAIATTDSTATDSPRKKSFWSFLYLSSSTTTAATSASSSSGTRDLKQHQPQQEAAADSKAQTKTYSGGGVCKEEQEAVAESPGGSQASSSSFGRKVARSRSVGCGSRSFSGDFLERISTGFGDCTLRRVESHRESNNKHGSSRRVELHHHDSEEQRIEERVKCGGIFGGFGIMSSSSTYWLSAAAAGSGDDDFDTVSSRIGSNTTARASSEAIVRGGGGRSRSWAWAWVWAFASPMRAFRPATASSSSAKSYAHNNAISSINAAVISNGGGINSGKIIKGGSVSNAKVDVTTTNPPSLLAVGVR